MRLLSVEVDDLARIKAPYTLPLDKQGLVLVEGENLDGGSAVSSNAAGKSLAVVEAMTWILFDRMVRHGDKPIGAAAQNPRTGRAGGRVHFESGSFAGCIERSRPPVKLDVWDARNPDRPRDLSKDPARRAEEAAALLGIDYAAWRYAVVVQAAEALADGGFARQMAVVESLLRLDQLSDAADLSRREGNDLGAQIRTLQTEHDLTSRALADATQLHTRLSASTAVRPEEREQFLPRIEAAKTAATRLEALTAAVTRTEEAVRRARSKSYEENASIAPLSREKQQREAKLSSLVCSECGRPYGSEEETAAARESAKARIEVLTEQISKAFIRKQSADQEAATGDLRLHKQKEELREQQRLADALPDLQRQIEALDRLEAERAEQLSTLTRRIDEHGIKLTELEEAIADLRPAYLRKTFWAADFGRDRLQAHVFSQGLPELNRAAHRYSLALTGGLFEVQFQVDRGSRAEDMIRLEGEASAPTYAGLSRGEKERTNLVVALSLRALARWRLGQSINLSVFDEVFDHVDEKGLKVAADLLAEEAAGGSTVIVVTHNPQLKALFPGARLIRVVREGGEAVVHYVS